MIPENGARISVFASRAAASASAASATFRLFSASSRAWPEMKPCFCRSIARSYLAFASVMFAFACWTSAALIAGSSLTSIAPFATGWPSWKPIAGHAAGDFGAHGHRFVRAQAADRGDRLRHRRGRRGDRLDQHRGRRARPTLCPPRRRRPGARSWLARRADALLAEPVAAAGRDGEGDDNVMTATTDIFIVGDRRRKTAPNAAKRRLCSARAKRGKPAPRERRALLRVRRNESIGSFDRGAAARIPIHSRRRARTLVVRRITMSVSALFRINDDSTPIFAVR